MKREHVHSFLQLLGCERISDNNDWVSASCPFARWRHSSRTDRHPSFGVLVNATGVSIYKCFTCKHKAATLDRLVFSVSKYRGVYLKRASDFYNTHEVFDDKPTTPEDKWEVQKQGSLKTHDPSILFEYPLLSSEIVPQYVREIVRERGSLISVSDYHGVRWHPEKDALLFPSFYQGNLTAIKYRSTRKKLFSFLYPGIYLFGYNRLQWDKPVWIVEGEFDLLRLNALGVYNVLCIGGSNISKSLGRVLHCHTVFLGLDNDDSGRKGTEIFKSLFSGEFHIRQVNWGDIKDAGALRDREHLNSLFNF